MPLDHCSQPDVFKYHSGARPEVEPEQSKIYPRPRCSARTPHPLAFSVRVSHVVAGLWPARPSR